MHSITMGNFIPDKHELYRLGLASSTGTTDTPYDLVSAHKWFNLAVMFGNTDALGIRAELSKEMTAAQIAEAQKQARMYLSGSLQNKS